VSGRARLRTALNVSALNIVLPKGDVGPGRVLLRRLAIALTLLLVATLVVFAQHRGYHDITGQPPDFVDSLYYATVSLSTTGYGDIVPVSTSARVVNIVVITPLRLVFLIVLVGTTIEVLTATVSRRARARRWRSSVHDHVVIVGYGTKGRAAAGAIVDAGTPLEQVAVIDLDSAEADRAAEAGLTAICGDATRTAVLEQVAIRRAGRVVIATNRDDTSVLVTLTVRQLNTTATLVASVRLGENADLLRSAGANAVVVSAEAAGRLLGISADSPATADVMTDLLDAGTGLEVVERAADERDTGRMLPSDPDTLLAIVRDGRVITELGPDPENRVHVQPGDKLVVVRHAAGG
jgi:voltage-gated potassium channel